MSPKLSISKFYFNNILIKCKGALKLISIYFYFKYKFYQNYNEGLILYFWNRI